MTTTEDTWAGPAGALFRSLGHEYRLEIMELLRAGPLSGDQLAARMGTPKQLLVPHLTRLQRDNLISSRRGKRVLIYTLTGDRGLAIMDLLKRMYGQA